MTTLHAIGNWIFHFFGFQGSGPYYGAWSGSLSDIGELTILGAVIVGLRRINCHDHGCWRIGAHPIEGTPFKSCRRHHPVLSKHPRITAEIMHAAHAEVLTRARETQSKLDEIHRHVTATAPDAGTFEPPKAKPRARPKKSTT